MRPAVRVEAHDLEDIESHVRRGKGSSRAMANDPSNLLPAIGEIVDGKYRIEDLLGEGGMGSVFSAWHLQLDHRVALKFMAPDLASNPEASARFLREAKIVSRLTSRHVSRVFDIATSATGLPYIVMEYLDGRDLDSLLEDHGRFPLADAVDYVLQASAAVGEAHKLGVVHRDLKPANMFLAEGSNGETVVKVLDFGISKMKWERNAHLELTLETANLGSPSYMSPEQWRSSRSVDAAADVWALGVVLYYFVTGKKPFGEENLIHLASAIQTRAPVRPSAYRSELPSEVELVILRCLEKDRAERFADANEFADALRRAFESTGSSLEEPDEKDAGYSVTRIGFVSQSDGWQRSESSVVVRVMPEVEAPTPNPSLQEPVSLPMKSSSTGSMLLLAASVLAVVGVAAAHFRSEGSSLSASTTVRAETEAAQPSSAGSAQVATSEVAATPATLQVDPPMSVPLLKTSIAKNSAPKNLTVAPKPTGRPRSPSPTDRKVVLRQITVADLVLNQRMWRID